MILSPITSYADQIIAIHRSKSSDGFSLDIPLIMLVASILKYELRTVVFFLLNNNWGKLATSRALSLSVSLSLTVLLFSLQDLLLVRRIL